MEDTGARPKFYHDACSAYCGGQEHVLLVTAVPEMAFDAFVAYTTSLGGVLRHAAPAEVDPATFEPQWNFTVETQQYTLITTWPPGVIVWRLHVDCTHMRGWPPTPAAVHLQPQGTWRRLWRWVWGRRTQEDVQCNSGRMS